MPLDIQTFKTRVLTALIFGVVMLTGLLWNEWSFYILFLVVTGVSSYEYFILVMRIHEQIDADMLQLVSYVLLGLLLYSFLFFMPIKHTHGLVMASVSAKCMYVAAGLITANLFLFYKNNFLQYATGWAYIALSMAALGQLRHYEMLLPIALIVCIWINDTMAYICGSLFGKRKIFPTISPKKTWEGTLGGIVITICIAIAWGYFSKKYTMLDWAVLGFIASVGGTFGDLIESQLKRWAQVKDSGSFMPGHGGALDRFDSLLFCAPLLFVYETICM